MKRRMCLLLLGCVCFMSACSSSTETAGKASDDSVETAEAETEVVQTDDSAEDSEEHEDIYLELDNFRDYSPEYYMSFHKIDPKTGDRVAFEDGAVSEDDTVDDLEINPADGIEGLSYVYEDEDTLSLEFWNRGEADTITITVDGLDYELALPEVEHETIAAAEAVSFDGYEVTVQEYEVYPNALIIKFSDVSEEEFERLYLIEDPEQGEEMLAPSVSYDSDSGSMDLLFRFENGLSADNLSLKIQQDMTAQDKEYFTYAINLEG